jgi:uncharacterized protein YkwD
MRIPRLCYAVIGTLVVSGCFSSGEQREKTRSPGHSESLGVEILAGGEALADAELEPEIAQAVALLNRHRELIGVPPVVVDKGLHSAAAKHAAYLYANFNTDATVGLKAHKETPGVRGYSPEGARAGGSSVIAYRKSPVGAINVWLATYYHRMPLISAKVDRIGYGFDARPTPPHQSPIWGAPATGPIAVLASSAGQPWRGPNPVLYPADGQKDVPLLFEDEVPSPRPAESGRKPLGFPITARFASSIDNVSARLFLDDTEVPAYVFTPQSPARADTKEFGTVCILPKRPLRAAADYRVLITARVSDVETKRSEWCFSTEEPQSVRASDIPALIALDTHAVRITGLVSSALFSRDGSLRLRLLSGEHYVLVDVSEESARELATRGLASPVDLQNFEVSLVGRLTQKTHEIFRVELGRGDSLERREPAEVLELEAHDRKSVEAAGDKYVLLRGRVDYTRSSKDGCVVMLEDRKNPVVIRLRGEALSAHASGASGCHSLRGKRVEGRGVLSVNVSEVPNIEVWRPADFSM